MENALTNVKKKANIIPIRCKSLIFAAENLQRMTKEVKKLLKCENRVQMAFATALYVDKDRAIDDLLDVIEVLRHPVPAAKRKRKPTSRVDLRDRTLSEEKIRASIAICDAPEFAVELLIARIISLQKYIVELQSQIAYFRSSRVHVL